MRSARPAAATRCLSPSRKGRLSTVARPITTAEKSGYCGKSRHIASMKRSVPFWRRTRPNAPMRVFSRQTRFGEGRAPVRRRGIEIDVDAVMDDGRRARHVSRRRLAGRDDRIHPRDQKVGEPSVASLRGRIEDERKPIADEVQNQPGQHFNVAARMPNAELMAAGRAEAQPQRDRSSPSPRSPPAYPDQTRPLASASRSKGRSYGSPPCRPNSASSDWE